MVETGVYSIPPIKRGEPYSFTFRLKDQDTQVVIPLDNLSVASQIRIQQDIDSAKIVDFTCKVDGVAVPNAAPTDNIIELSLTAVQTAAITQDTGFYDVLINNEDYYLEGPAVIEESDRVTEPV